MAVLQIPRGTLPAARSAGATVVAAASAFDWRDARVEGNGGAADVYVDLPHLCNGRLTLVSGDSGPTADQTARSTLYWTPAGGNQLSLFDNTRWRKWGFAETALSLAGIVSGKLYDVFAYFNGSSIALALSAAWTSDSARADSVVLQNGVPVLSADKTRRLLGTICASGSGVTEDSAVNRFVVNTCNALPRRLYTCPGGVDNNALNYWVQAAGSGWAEMNYGTGARVSYLSCGFPAARAHLTGHAVGDPVAYGNFGIGDDSVSTSRAFQQTNGVRLNGCVGTGLLEKAAGKHFVALLSWASGGACNWYADVPRDGGVSDPASTYLEGWVLA